MRSIHISPAVQLLGLLALVGAIVAAVLAQMPEIQRYLNVRSMDVR